MKWSKPKMLSLSVKSYTITARRNGFKAKVTYNGYYDRYYFITEKEGKIYNSAWDNLNFKTEKECIDACEKWIDERG